MAEPETGMQPSLIITYHSEYGIVPAPYEIYGIYVFIITDNEIPSLTADNATFEGWYTTNTFDADTKVEVGDEFNYGSYDFYAKWSSTVTVASKLTAIANNLRAMTNTTDPMGLDAMAGHVNDANIELGEQDVLMEELLASLEGKSVPGDGEDISAETAEYTAQLDELESTIDSLPDAGSGGASVETCMVTFYVARDDIAPSSIYYVNENFQLLDSIWDNGTTITTIKGTIIIVRDSGGSYVADNATLIDRTEFGDLFFHITGDATITIG